MASPCGEESLQESEWIHCSICGVYEELIECRRIGGKYLCNHWRALVTCFSLIPNADVEHRKERLALKKQEFVTKGHSEHCAEYMLAINRGNCICSLKQTSNPK